jgi:hypothetical protein
MCMCKADKWPRSQARGQQHVSRQAGGSTNVASMGAWDQAAGQHEERQGRAHQQHARKRLVALRHHTAWQDWPARLGQAVKSHPPIVGPEHGGARARSGTLLCCRRRATTAARIGGGWRTGRMPMAGCDEAAKSP